MMLKNLKNAEWSKKILIVILLLIIFCGLASLIAVFCGLSDPLMAFVTGIMTLANVAVGFYYWKAKNENIRKYAEKIDKKDINKVVAMYDAILSGEDKTP